MKISDEVRTRYGRGTPGTQGTPGTPGTPGMQGHNFPVMVDSCQMDGLARTGAHGILRTTTKAALRTGVSRTLVKKKIRIFWVLY